MTVVRLLEFDGRQVTVGFEQPVRPRDERSSRTALQRVHRLAPQLPTVQLVDSVPRHLLVRMPAGHAHVGPSVELLRAVPQYVARAHRRGREVHAWTVNEPADIELCLRTGVDVIITDRPATVLAALPPLRR